MPASYGCAHCGKVFMSYADCAAHIKGAHPAEYAAALDLLGIRPLARPPNRRERRGR